MTHLPCCDGSHYEVPTVIPRLINTCTDGHVMVYDPNSIFRMRTESFSKTHVTILSFTLQVQSAINPFPAKDEYILFMAKITFVPRRGWGIKVDATMYVLMILVNEFHII